MRKIPKKKKKYNKLQYIDNRTRGKRGYFRKVSCRKSKHAKRAAIPNVVSSVIAYDGHGEKLDFYIPVSVMRSNDFGRHFQTVRPDPGGGRSNNGL